MLVLCATSINQIIGTIPNHNSSIKFRGRDAAAAGRDGAAAGVLPTLGAGAVVGLVGVLVGGRVACVMIMR